MLALGGCTTLRAGRDPAAAQPPPAAVGLHSVAPPTPVAGEPSNRHVPPTPVSPFADSPVSFFIHGNFARGELVIVRVCLRADRSIASSDVIESSGDQRFDELAASWAQRVRLREHPPEGRPVASCGAVRVELREAPEPAVVDGHSDQLG
jgi:hypothetical protein